MSIEALQHTHPTPTPPPAPADGRTQLTPPVKAPGKHDAPSASADRPDERALAAVQTAARVYEQLRAADRELHFATSETGDVRIEVYDGRGELIRRIPPNEALALAAEGAMTWQA